MKLSESVGTIDTERLTLRAWTETDAEDLFEYAKNPNVGPHGGWKPHESVEESIEIINSLFLEKYQSWAIVLKETGKVIGSIGYEEDPIRKIERCRELGYALAESSKSVASSMKVLCEGQTKYITGRFEMSLAIR